MTKPEFKEWINYHFAAFPSCRSWLKKFPRERTESVVSLGAVPTQGEIVANWFRTLEPIDLADAKRATDELSSGDDPTEFERTPAKVRKHALSIGRMRRFVEQPKRHEGREPRYDCWRCSDTGFAPIVNQEDIETIAESWPEGLPDRFNYRPISDQAIRRISLGPWSCACSCKRGETKTGMLKFDAERSCYFTGKNYQDVRDWFAARAVRIAQSRKFNEWEPA